MRAELRALLVGAAVLYLAGIWWGLSLRWAPDELVPAFVFDAIDVRFSGGWHDKYPPMQYYLGAVLYFPVAIAAHLGWVDLASAPTNAALVTLLRLLTVAMAVGTVAAVYLTAADLYGRRGAFAAALLAGFTPTFVFYAKLGNVDVPSIFWLAWALRWYVRGVQRDERRALWWCAATGVTAIATKDQTAGFVILPACHLAYLWLRRGEWRPLLTAAAIAAGLFAIEFNLPFNTRGIVAHVEMITGEASAPFRLPGSTWTRQLMVAKLTWMELAWSMTWVGLAAGLAGVAVELRRRRFLWFLLPAVSYYLFFVMVAGYVYDRFLIGVCLVLAIFAGGWIDGLLRAGAPAARWRWAAGVVAGAFIVWSGVSMDLMMALDSRYPASQWIQTHRSGGRVGLVGHPEYLPHVPAAMLLGSGPADYQPDQQPRLIVVNAEVMRRDRLPPLEREWRAWLADGHSRYVVAARFKTLPPFSLLSYTDVFRNGVEDTTTNLDKAGPEIVVYWNPDVLR